jgi:hypothetical protein
LITRFSGNTVYDKAFATVGTIWAVVRMPQKSFDHAFNVHHQPLARYHFSETKSG